ncbi:MAG: gluconate 2-dehydrogenase subunit 3 family protein, partial [Chloroflexi bacterium]|nr:gluconate 2-dehydrogenase subunit 3 family protein [Chloroflexota bacterium]
GWLAQAMAAPASEGFVFFDAHQGAVVVEATARLIPGPDDDPLEAGHAGAREANVVRYIDVLLGAFTTDPPQIFAGGPWSDRSGGAVNHFEGFVPLSPLQDTVWRSRIAGLQKTYRDGIAGLDAATGGDFTAASADEKDQALADAGEFLNVLFTHAIEGFLSAPEYGGNEDLVGWNEISWKGDSQPRGYTPAEVGESDGLDPVVPDVLIAAVMANFDAAALEIAARRRGGR